MNELKLTSAYRRALVAVGVICFLAAVLHGVWHVYLPGYSALEGLDPVQLGTMRLLNAAITLFILFTGLAAFWGATSKTMGLVDVRTLCLLIGSFWVARFLLELLMPLQIPFVFLDEPNLFIRIVILLPIGILAVPFLLTKRSA